MIKFFMLSFLLIFANFTYAINLEEKDFRSSLEEINVYAFDKNKKKYYQEIRFDGDCMLKVIRNYPDMMREKIQIPLKLMDSSRTRVVFTNFDASIYWRARSFSVEVKALKSRKPIGVFDKKGKLMYYSDYAWVHAENSESESSQEIKELLKKSISECS